MTYVLECLGQTVSDMSDTSGVTDLCLNSGMFLSGSGIIVWHLSGHSLFSLHQTAARYTPDTPSRFFPASPICSALIRQQPDTPQTHITGSSAGLRSHQTQVIQTYNWAAHRYNWYCRTCTTIQLPTLWKAAKSHLPRHPTEQTMVISS